MMSAARAHPPLSLNESHERALARRREERLVEVLNREAEGLTWFLWARIGNDDEDDGGVDVVVLTADLGALTLQVKSSMAGRRGYEHQARVLGDPVRLWTRVVIVKDSEPDWVVFAKALGALVLAREAREKAMRSVQITDGRRH
jgi:hypothetical protein